MNHLVGVIIQKIKTHIILIPTMDFNNEEICDFSPQHFFLNVIKDDILTTYNTLPEYSSAKGGIEMWGNNFYKLLK